MATSRDSHASELTLELLLRRTGRGDPAAFAQLFDLLSPRVHGLVLRVLRDSAQSEEVTQEVMLEIWERASQFDAERGGALGWAMTLAHRRAVDRVRHTEAFRRRDHNDIHRNWQPPVDHTEETVHASFEAQRVRVALRGLTAAQRQAIELAYFDGHTYLEVSRMLQIPAGTAKSRIRDGLIRLRMALVPTVAEPA